MLFLLTKTISCAMFTCMKLTLQLQLLPDAAQETALRATMERFNEAANWIAAQLFARQTTNKITAQQLYYREVRERFGLSAQMAILCIRRVCEAYKRDKSKQPNFRNNAAITYDPRTFRVQKADRVSLLTIEGRISVPFLMGTYQHERFGFAKGQADLVRRKDGTWFLLLTVDLPDGTPIPSTDFLGVDLGIVHLATTSDGDTFTGETVERVRQRHHRNRQRLQRRGTRGTKKRLRRLAGREARFRRHENHRISKRLVALAKGTGRGIALEDLKGIRTRTESRLRKRQRARHTGWAFHQLRAFIEYKARLAGVSVVLVDPRYSSRTCSRCGHCEKANRNSQAEFSCKRCGLTMNADYNAALVLSAWATRKLASELLGSPAA